MSYLSTALIRQDSWIRDRVAACVALEGVAGDPVQWALDRAWELATQPGWASAWDSALARDIAEPGRDAGVISDAQILSAVQSILAKG